jgi:uncharacterized membrane protein
MSLLDAAPIGSPAAAVTAAIMPQVAARPRLDSIDLLRGAVMVLMALDHARDFFGASGMNPRDVTEPALFLTRWVTHFCAPVFIFLSGVSAYLYGARGRSAAELSRFLLTRGFWLIVVEFSIVRAGWMFGFGLDRFVAQVIWAIGASMVVLAGLVHLPRWAIATFGLALIGGHNLLDGIRAEQFGAAGWIWNLLHQPATLHPGPNATLLALYPLIPWVGVMAAGYAFGPVMKLERAARRRWLVGLGVLATAGFVMLRAGNLYGDPAPWTVQGTSLATVLSFINCEKYPPSLLYLTMTLGLGLLLLAAFELARGRIADWITTFGRVPLFYYVAHLYLIHALAIVLSLAMVGEASWLINQPPTHKPPGFGLALPGIYAVWLFAVVALYPASRWFADLKQRRREWWWSYL